MDLKSKIELPEGFLLGAASAAHQVEGNNRNSDWWRYEQEGRLPKSADAADHYNRYEEDFKNAKDLGLNAMRISIEWSRIEPIEGRWDRVAIEHYKKVLKNLKEQGFTRMVTLHHYTLPTWLADKGGFENQDAAGAFSRYAWFVAQNLGSEIDLWVTINEPEVFVIKGYKTGEWPPFKNNNSSVLSVTRNLIRSHKLAYDAIKQVIPDSQIGIAKNNAHYEPYRTKNILDILTSYFARTISNHYLLDKIKNHLDFVGVNYYNFNQIKFDWRKGLIQKNFNFVKESPEDIDEARSTMGWRTWPEGLYHILKDLRKYKKPIYITENGIANARDDMRRDFIYENLYWTTKAMEEGIDVRGYFYWSLTDTYEWDAGFGPKFGLVEVNLVNQQRTVRKYSDVFKDFKTL